MNVEAIAVDFGREIHRRREALGLTLDEFGALCGLTPNYIGTIENGHRDPSLSTIHALAKGLGVGAGELLGTSREVSPAGEEVGRLFDRVASEIQAGVLMILRACTKKMRR